MANEPPTKDWSYNGALHRIEDILSNIEREDVDIDKLGDFVEEAADLIRICRKKILHTEMRVRKVIDELREEEQSLSSREG